MREWFSQYMVRSAYHSSGFVAVHRDLPPFIGICRRSSGFAAVHRDLSLGTYRVTLGLSKNPDALSIRIFNPLKAHYKCLHSMRADCKYWSYGRNTTHRCIYIPWQCSGNRTTGPEHRGRHPCRAWRNRHDDLLLRQWEKHTKRAFPRLNQMQNYKYFLDFARKSVQKMKYLLHLITT